MTVTLLAKILQSRQQDSIHRARGQTLAQGGASILHLSGAYGLLEQESQQRLRWVS